MAMCVMPNDNSHSFNSVKDRVVEVNERVSFEIPSPSTVATISTLWMSSPQQRSTTDSNSTACDDVFCTIRLEDNVWRKDKDYSNTVVLDPHFSSSLA